MRKFTKLILLLYLCVFAFSTADAKPAPNLSRVQITHVGADHTGWIPASEIPSTTLYGQKFYIAVQFTGYPNPNQILLYQNGHLIPKSEITEPFGRTGIGNPFTGWVYQFAMPISYGNGTIAVQASGINGGQLFDTLYRVKSKNQP
ncbi:hypothetical protein AXX12_12320 [Anaerosporomusa subterranea]|uniref:DUF4879 domain-containing protein n=1 Tax=Anaerosporomusa subterranea TaxID=1794912 RepID=A0A154BNE2_ANASB|nr:DUF4879 domain-containing protein [Anaerosporomusa subterranea]KYZ75494.1 hypothetical protein AXX12_12320 [Anaerosporomusa subterranea]